MENINNLLAKALAETVDEDIIYGCDDNAIRWHNRIMREEVIRLKPKYIPMFIWAYWLKLK